MSEVLLHHVECGPVQLLNSAPTPATVLASLPGPDGADQLCIQLATPVKHRLPAGASDADYPPGQRGRDAHGPFLWIYHAALHPRVPGTDLAKPALDLPVDVSYILDPSIGQADVLDATKMVWVATAFLDHSPTPLPSWPDLEDLEPGIRTPGGPPPYEALEHRIEHALAQLPVVARISARRTLPARSSKHFPQSMPPAPPIPSMRTALSTIGAWMS